MTTLCGLDTRLLYLGLLALVVLERLGELVVTRRHLRRLLARGARVVDRRAYAVMVVMHTAFLVAAPLEVWLLRRPFVAPLAAAMVGLLVLSMALRYWAIACLGERWTTQIVVLSGAAPVESGPYRHLRHPNYLAVVVEVAALPLVHTAWLTAVVFSACNALVLRRRIRVEEAALAEHSPYLERLGDRPRLLPRPPRP